MEKTKVYSKEEVQKAVNEFKRLNENIILKEASGDVTFCSGEAFDCEGVIKALDNITKLFVLLRFANDLKNGKTVRNGKVSLADIEKNFDSVLESAIYASLYIRFEAMSESARQEESAVKPEE